MRNVRKIKGIFTAAITAVAIAVLICVGEASAQVNVSAVQRGIDAARMKRIKENIEEYLAQARQEHAAQVERMLMPYKTQKRTDGEVKANFSINHALGSGRKNYVLYFKDAQTARAFKRTLDKTDSDMRRTVKAHYSSWDIPDRAQIDRIVDNWLNRCSLKAKMRVASERHANDVDNYKAADRYADNGKRQESLYERTRGGNDTRSGEYESVSSMNDAWLRYQEERMRAPVESKDLESIGNSYKIPELPALLFDEENTDDISARDCENGYRYAMMALDVYEDEELKSYLGPIRKIEDAEEFLSSGPLLNGRPLDENTKKVVRGIIDYLNNQRYADGEMGFLASLYYDPESQSFCLSYAGTSGLNIADNKTNLLNQLGKESPQMNMAYHISAMIGSLPENVRKNFSTTGHSLGGALASMTSALTGIDCGTFNAEGIPEITLQNYAAKYARLMERSEVDVMAEMKNNASKIKAYYSADDILSRVQDSNLVAPVIAAATPSVSVGMLRGNPVEAVKSVVKGYSDAKERGLVASALGTRIKIGKTNGGMGHSMKGVFNRMEKLRSVTATRPSTKGSATVDSRLKSALKEIGK